MPPIPPAPDLSRLILAADVARLREQAAAHRAAVWQTARRLRAQAWIDAGFGRERWN